MLESIEKLRRSSHLDDEKWTLETGGVVRLFGSEPNDPNAINWGEQWRELADEIEREISERYIPLPVDADGVLWTAEDREFDSGINGVIEINMIAYSPKTGEWYLLDDTKSTHVARLSHHVKPPTVEDILCDFAKEVFQWTLENDSNGTYMEFTDSETNKKKISKYVNKLRDLFGGDA